MTSGPASPARPRRSCSASQAALGLPVRTGDDVVGADDPNRQRRLDWATLMKRAYAVDVLACPRCQGPMRLVSVVQDERVARRILEHLGLPARAPPHGRPWRPALQLALDDPNDYDGVDATYPS